MSDDSLIPVPVIDPLKLAWFELNDFGNARRLEEMAGGELKWVDDKYWAAFDGQRWSKREGGYRARALAHQVAQHLHDEAAALGELIGDPDRPNEAALQERYGAWINAGLAKDRLSMLHKHAIKSGNATQTNGMLAQAKDMAAMRAWSEEFDVDPLTYNVQNGTLRFRKKDGVWGVQFQKGHEARDMLMQMSNWTYDPAAICPMWTTRLELVQPDDDARAVFPRMYGQTLTGLTDSEEFYVHKGRGGDGKTKTHEIIAHGHGDYHRHASVSTWLQATNRRSGAEHRRDLVDLSGDVRFILSDEPPPGATWDGELLKQWTGGGQITAYGAGATEATVFKPRSKVFVEVNPTPKMPGDDKGFRRRFRLVQWLVDLSKIEGGFESPAAIRERLWSEESGILNWLIAGALEWLADRRVPVPEREGEALADFWATGNPLGEWLDEECDLTDRDAETGSKVLLDAFKAWMERNEVDEDAQKRWNATKFGRELSQRQVVIKKDRRGNKVRRGIRLRAADPLLRDDGEDDRALSREAPPVPPKAAAPEFPPQEPFDDGYGDDDELGGWGGDR